MLSIATSKLRVAVEVAQKSHNGGRVTKCRMYSTDAPKGGAGSGKSAGGEGSNHKQGSYTYKQAYENSQRNDDASKQRSQNNEQRRASAAKKFEGMKTGEGGARTGSFGARRGGDKGPSMPQEQSGGRTDASEVRQARESANYRSPSNRFGGMRGSGGSKPSQPWSSSVTSSSQGATMVNKEGDDKIFAGARTTEGGYQGGRQQQGGQGGGRSSSSSSSSSGSSPSGRPSSSSSSSSSRPSFPSSPKKRSGGGGGGGRGRDNTDREDEEFLSRPADLSGSRLVGLGGVVPDGLSADKKARLAELDRMADAEDAGGMTGVTINASHTFEKRMVDADVAGFAEGDDVAEQGEERLVSDVQREMAAERSAANEKLARLQLLAAHKAAQELSAERGMVDDLPELDARRTTHFSSADQSDPTLRRLVESDMPRIFTAEEILDADSRSEVLTPETVITPAEMEEEHIEMETGFSFGPQSNEISLHSEKGLLYGVVDMFDRMVTEKKRQLLVKARKQKRFEIWRAVSWKLREKKRKVRAERQLKQRLEAREKFFQNQKDPEMMYYPELNLWFSKTELKDDVVRNAVSAAVSNPTWSRSRRREFLSAIRKDLARLAKPVTDKEKKQLDTLFAVSKPSHVSDMRTIEHLLPLPTTDWSLLMAQAERAMDPADRSRRFDPSPFEKSNNTKL